MSQSLAGVARVGALSVLEECIDALAVYRGSLENLVLHVRLDSNGRMLDTRKKCYDEINSEDIYEITNEELIFEKLKQDSKWLEELMRATIRSLEVDGNLDVLINEIVSKMAVRVEEDELLTDAHEMQEKLMRIRQEIAKEQRMRKDEEERLKADLLKLRNEKERLLMKSSAEMTYVKAWLHSRHEQDDLRVEISRNRLENQLLRCRRHEEAERLVSENVREFLRCSMKQYEKDTQGWLERRQTETRLYDKEIRQLQEQIEERRTALEELHQEYTSKQQFIDNCLAEKEETRRRQELQEHLRCCVVKIQSWWRGVMVRRKLGPYRPEEKKRKRPVKPKK